MTKRHSLPAFSAALVLGTACVWPSPERQLLVNFCQACRVYDRTTMARMATVSCNPRTDGVVQDFDIAGVASPSGGWTTSQRRHDTCAGAPV